MKHISPFPYYGGKDRLMPFLQTNFLPAYRFVDLFGGSAVVSFSVVGQYKSVVYNDIDHRIVNFFRTLRDKETELVRSIDLTPFSRHEFFLAFEEAEDDIEDARRVFTRITQSVAGLGLWRRTGWSTPGDRRCRIPRMESRIAALSKISAILRKMTLECKDWRWMIKRYGKGDVFIYADPPYDMQARNGIAYGHEMSEQDHCELAEALWNTPSAAVSGYRSELYDRLYAGWIRKDLTHSCSHVPSERTECLWVKTANGSHPLFRGAS